MSGRESVAVGDEAKPKEEGAVTISELNYAWIQICELEHILEVPELIEVPYRSEKFNPSFKVQNKDFYIWQCAYEARNTLNYYRRPKLYVGIVGKDGEEEDAEGLIEDDDDEDEDDDDDDDDEDEDEDDEDDDEQDKIKVIEDQVDLPAISLEVKGIVDDMSVARAIGRLVGMLEPSLKLLKLIDCSLTAMCASIIANALKLEGCVEYLYLDRNPSNYQQNFYLFANYHNLKLLSLKYCDISDVGAKLLAGNLSWLGAPTHHIITLDLTGNNIGSEGAIEIAKVLRWNRSIKRLILTGNRINDSGAEALASVLIPFEINVEEDQTRKTRYFDRQKLLKIAADRVTDRVMYKTLESWGVDEDKEDALVYDRHQTKLFEFGVRRELTDIFGGRVVAVMENRLNNDDVGGGMTARDGDDKAGGGDNDGNDDGDDYIDDKDDNDGAYDEQDLDVLADFFENVERAEHMVTSDDTDSFRECIRARKMAELGSDCTLRYLEEYDEKMYNGGDTSRSEKGQESETLSDENNKGKTDENKKKSPLSDDKANSKSVPTDVKADKNKSNDVADDEGEENDDNEELSLSELINEMQLEREDDIEKIREEFKSVDPEKLKELIARAKAILEKEERDKIRDMEILGWEDDEEKKDNRYDERYSGSVTSETTNSIETWSSFGVLPVNTTINSDIEDLSDEIFETLYKDVKTIVEYLHCPNMGKGELFDNEMCMIYKEIQDACERKVPEDVHPIMTEVYESETEVCCPGNYKIEYINLSYNKIGKKGIKKFIDALERRKNMDLMKDTPLKLILKGNRLEEGSALMKQVEQLARNDQTQPSAAAADRVASA
ncbi:hypothetical protein O3M35_002945 [Rhynocoris fuscipes]|uniref:Uncharacterized protein n=1 Tax=Rhynocoris fuscipes TaxID=488301 RepID=A0AAW1CJL2_9HEMI